MINASFLARNMWKNSWIVMHSQPKCCSFEVKIKNIRYISILYVLFD